MSNALDFHLITGDTTSHTILQAFEQILKKGVDIETRNGAARTIFNAFMITDNPRFRHLALLGRNSNIFQMIAETLWVLSGSGKVTGFLEYLLPRATNYSDDGENWRGAYGPRLIGDSGFDQLDAVVDAFVLDGLNTRRAIAAIYNPALDSQTALTEVYGLQTTKDLPCNLLLNFYTDALGRFCLKLVQRSGDCLFGAGSINPFEFTLIQELVYSRVKAHYPTLQLGTFVHDVTNLHVYEQFKAQAQAAVNTEQPVWHINTDKFQSASIKCSFRDLSHYLALFVQACESYILEPTDEALADLKASYINANMVFNGGPSVNGNLLSDYMFITLKFLIARLGLGVEGDKILNLSCNCQEDLVLAITQSKFNPFEKVLQHDGIE
uniref:Thymidylate synthase n=1 Tax=Pseudomonas phage Cygsa01 TaxID=3138529 RepID=A0AAU6W3A8_9VIRU